MEWVRKWGVVLFFGVLGLGLIVYGFWDQLRPREVKVEIVKEQGTSEKVKVGGEIMVDVAGAVEKPGVYKLPSNSRIGDALVVAGGLSVSADREWVAATLNLAEKLEDGEKVYIPDKSVNQISSNLGLPDDFVSGDISRALTRSMSTGQKININTASVSELDSLAGIGASRAQAIIDNRPYSKTEELVSKAKIPQSVYDKISTSISVY